MESFLSKKYGTFEDLSPDIETKVNSHLAVLDSSDIEYTAYYGYPVIGTDNSRSFVNCIIICKSGVYVLSDHEEERIKYVSKLTELIAGDYDLFGKIRRKDFLKEVELSTDNIISDMSRSEIFDSYTVSQINRAIQQSYGISKADFRDISKESSLGNKIKKRNTYIGKYDVNQFNAIHKLEPSKNFRIRGLAGSGKTVLMVKRMAYLHFRNPTLELGYVFFTVSLRQYIMDLFKSYYQDYDRGGQPDMSKIHILYCWGNSSRSGFYSKICQDYGLTYYNFGEARANAKRNEAPLDYVSRMAIDECNEKNIEIRFFDHIFVDEAQDFGLKFFKLIKKSLKHQGAFSYAYDELQSLSNDNTVPTKSEIFDEGEICADVNLDISYRVPVEILVTAHAIGTGIYRSVEEHEQPIVNMIEDMNVWSDIGYKTINGKLDFGHNVTLSRNEKLIDERVIFTENVTNRREQYNILSAKIIDLLTNEDILAEDIIIIDQDSYSIHNNFNSFQSIFNSMLYESHLIGDDGKPKVLMNLVDRNNPSRMKIKNAISYTTVYRAKGNESNIVFIVNVQSLESVKSVSRNMIFTAMTRARYAVWLMGVEIDAYESEVKKVEENGFKLEFTYPTKDEMSRIKNYGRKESAVEHKIKSTYKNVEEIGKIDPELAKGILHELLKNLEEKNDE